MHGELDGLEGPQQALQSVRQADGRGRIREQERAHDEQRDAQHHRDGGAHALDGHAEDPPVEDLRAGRVEEIQQRCKGDDEQNRLQALEERLRAHVRDAHGDHERQNEQSVGDKALRSEERHNIEHRDKELCARVEPVGERIAREILSQRDILQHFLPPPFFSAISSALSSSTV